MGKAHRSEGETEVEGFRIRQARGQYDPQDGDN